MRTPCKGRSAQELQSELKIKTAKTGKRLHRPAAVNKPSRPAAQGNINGSPNVDQIVDL
jgi:hypothetical protein